MRIVDDVRVAQFVGEQNGTAIVPPFTCMGIEKNGQIISGVVFNHYTGADIHVTIAGRYWPPSVLAEVGHYVFDRLKCLRMTGVTEQPRVVRIAERLGGQVEGLMRDHFGKGRDAFIVGLLKDDWTY